MAASAKFEYGKLVERLLDGLFPKFVENFREQKFTQQEFGRVAVFEFPEAEPVIVDEFRTSRELETHLNLPSNAGSTKRRRRRLFVLEDLSRSFIEILGSKLLVPPSFFADHWADPASPDTHGPRDSFHVDLEKRFLLQYCHFYKLRGNWSSENEDQTLVPQCHVERIVYFGGSQTKVENPSFARSYNKLSYWGKNCGDGSWDGKHISAVAEIP
jgi:hypothetical protein